MTTSDQIRLNKKFVKALPKDVECFKYTCKISLFIRNQTQIRAFRWD